MRRVAAVLVALGGLVAAKSASADGAHVVARGAAGPFEVVVLVSPAPLRAGPSEWSVLVRDPSDGRIVLDSTVGISLESEDASHHSHGRQGVAALRSASANRLLHTARLELPSSGAWRARVDIRSPQGAGRITAVIPVAPAAAPLVAHWRAFALPPLCLALFALHQGLVLRGGGRR